MSNNFAFPHGELTKVIGLPINASLQVLKSQLGNNAASVPSRHSGGAHGHLGIVMDAVEYMAVSNNIPWIDPVHPGELPVHGTGATAILPEQINCQYDADLAAYELYNKVSNALKHRILLAVEPTFLQALAHPRLGFMTVTPLVMIWHLDDTYDRLKPGEIEANHLALSTPWNPDRPIEDLWASVDTICCIAEDGKAPMTEVSTISLLLYMFETSGLLSSTTEKFRLSEPSTWTLEQFKQEINHGNAERLCRLTTGVAGYHGALATTASAAAVAQVAKPCPADTDIMCDGIQLYYCWSHGLSGYANHTSKTCVNRKAGHNATAALANQHGGVYIRIPGQNPPKPHTVHNVRRALAAHTVNDTSDNNI
jgi:hypothetical protein